MEEQFSSTFPDSGSAYSAHPLICFLASRVNLSVALLLGELLYNHVAQKCPSLFSPPHKKNHSREQGQVVARVARSMSEKSSLSI